MFCVTNQRGDAMSLSDLAKPIQAFLDATRARDTEALLATFTEDAVLSDMGKDHRGAQIRAWNEALYLGSNVRVHPLHVEEREGQAVLAVAVDGDYESYGVTEPFQLDWYFALRGERIASLRMVEVKLALPKPVVAFVKAMNMYDGDAVMATFAEGALVNDQQREHLGKSAIRRWLDKEIIGDQVTMYVTETRDHAGACAVIAKVTGAYDKTGLPDPLTLRFYFSYANEGITQLVIVPVKRDAA